MLALLQKRNILILTICQVLFWTSLMVGITVSGLVGHILADNKALATWPAGFFAIAAIFATRPASVFMQKYGRRYGFLAGAMMGLAGGLLCTVAIFRADFYLFCVGNVVLGAYQAIGLYYRLAAADSVSDAQKPTAISIVMAGGIVAALIVPTLSVWSKDLFSPIAYAGSYLAVAVIAVLIALVLTFLENQKAAAEEDVTGGRSLLEVFRQPMMIMAVVNTAVGQGVMVLLMLSTPLAMQACNYGLEDASTVIQWHVLGMFVPSFFTGRLIQKFGASNVALTGVAILSVSITVAAAGIDFMNFGIALILLGIGWNFMFLSGTTMVTLAHTSEERGRVQGAAEMVTLTVAAVSSFASGMLLDGIGWTAVNLGAIPLLLAAAAITWLCNRKLAGQVSAEAKA